MQVNNFSYFLALEFLLLFLEKKVNLRLVFQWSFFVCLHLNCGLIVEGLSEAGGAGGENGGSQC